MTLPYLDTYFDVSNVTTLQRILDVSEIYHRLYVNSQIYDGLMILFDLHMQYSVSSFIHITINLDN